MREPAQAQGQDVENDANHAGRVSGALAKEPGEGDKAQG
jgi:hypothetical protein